MHGAPIKVPRNVILVKWYEKSGDAETRGIEVRNVYRHVLGHNSRVSLLSKLTVVEEAADVLADGFEDLAVGVKGAWRPPCHNAEVGFWREL